MNKYYLLSLLLLKLGGAPAQHLGIGTPYPAFKLDVRGGSINTDSVYRIGGNTVISVSETGNTFTGIGSGAASAGGDFNTATGRYALSANTTGYENTAHGYGALFSNTTGNGNSAVGFKALYSPTAAIRNTAMGNSALYSNSTGSSNVATGYQSLFSNTTGSYNVVNGVFAMYHNYAGRFNTAMGHQAMQWNTTGDYNTALGYLALYNNNSGHENVALGRMALVYNTHGLSNTAIGNLALYNNKTSTGNTAIGYGAGNSYENGYYNTFLGSDADANGPGYYNSVAIGNSATVTAPLQVRIGGSFITSIGGYQNWTTISDGRFKTGVRDEVRGLDFILRLRPVTYHLDVSAISEKLNESRGREKDKQVMAAMNEKEKQWQSGFLAQDVEKAAKETGYDFSGVDKPKHPGDFYGLRYAEFVVPLVKAVQEQQELIRGLQETCRKLQAEIAGLRGLTREK